MAPRGLSAIRETFALALADRRREELARDPEPGDAEAWGYKAGRWPGAPAGRLPPACPVSPLGRDGDVYWFLDSMRQLNGVPRKDWSKKTLLDLFAARPNYPTHHWPRWGAPKKGKSEEGEPSLSGLEVDAAVQCLMHACALEGAIEIDAKVRGRGAWATATGELIWHAGDALFRLREGRLEASGPCAIEGVVYPGAPPILAPWTTALDEDDNPARQALADLASWNWGHPALDPVVLLGLIGCMLLGGALDWRPYGMLVGGAGTGKSTLQNYIRRLLGDALIHGSNVTEASLRQFGRRDSLAISIDEFEAAENNAKAMAVLELARIAASGDDILRGGADHRGAKFTMRSTFFFSAINAPPMGAADRSRVAIFALQPLDASRAKKSPVVAEEAGRKILRRLMNRWADLPDALETWRAVLREQKFSDRAQMTYGTLFAVAELMVGADWLDAEYELPIGGDAEARATLGGLVAHYTEEARAEQEENWAECAQRILAATIDAWRDGARPTVGSTLEAWEAGGGLTAAEANARLRLVGLAALERDGRKFLAVPLPVACGPAKILEATKFRDGVWAQALKQAPGEIVLRGAAGAVVKINRIAARAHLIDLTAFDRWAAGRGLSPRHAGAEGREI